MKLLLETNALVAALVARGTCSDLLEHCVRQPECSNESGFNRKAFCVKTPRDCFCDSIG